MAVAGEIGGAWQVAAQAADGILDGALLPGAVGVAEVGLAAELMMAGELAAIVEGEGAARLGGEATKQALERALGGLGGFAVLPGGEEQAGLALDADDQRPGRAAEGHEIAFPVTEAAPLGHALRPDMDGDAIRNQRSALALAGPPAASRLGSAEAAVELLAPPERTVDVAIDGLVADHRLTLFALEPAGDLFGRPSHGNELVVDGRAQPARALDLGSPPAAGGGHTLGRDRLITARQRIAPQLAADRALVPAEPAGDFAARYSACMQAEYRASLLFGELSI